MRAFVPGGRSRDSADLLLLGEIVLNADAFDDGVAIGIHHRIRAPGGRRSDSGTAAHSRVQVGFNPLARSADDENRRNGHNKERVHGAPFERAS